MIAYFDTSAFIPLVLDEPTSDTIEEIWSNATRLVSTRLLYVEARAALARARRTERLKDIPYESVLDELEKLNQQIQYFTVDDHLIELAGDLADILDLRGYDAVHLATVAFHHSQDMIMITNDRQMRRAARSLNLEVLPL